MRIDCILDTDVLIDLLRGNSGALQWFASHSDDHIALPVIVKMELLDGTRTRREYTELLKVLEPFSLAHLEKADSEYACRQFERLHFSAGPGIADCLIAAITIRLGVPLYTFNVRHYSLFGSLDVREPYAR